VERTDALLRELLREIAAEFPSFRIRKKRDSRLQRGIDVGLRVLTLGGQRHYLTHYHTVLFGELWVPDSWEAASDDDRYVLLRHERVHLRQRARMGDLRMGVLYLFVFLPLFLSYGRARIEWEAYEETLRALVEVAGPDAARRKKDWLRARFVGPDYGWMWPFPGAVDRWFEETMTRLEDELRGGRWTTEETLLALRSRTAREDGAREPA
jgi:hypothetical protein